MDNQKHKAYNFPCMVSQPKLSILCRRAEIEATLDRLSAQITSDYQDKNPLLIGILKGSFVFLADLVRRLDFPLEVDFIRLASYGAGRESSGKVRILSRPCPPVAGRHVLVVEDVIDTGLTLAVLLAYLSRKKPASLRLCALADKPHGRASPVKIDYVGVTLPDKFLVGYGLDCGERYRNLPEIYALEAGE
jgi:hypoxanthine phosphoribosyltransferase